MESRPPAVSRSQRYLVFAAAIFVTGVLAGGAGGATTLLLRGIEHLTYGYTQGAMLIGVRDASIPRRVVGPTIGCATAGLGWWLLRRKTAVPDMTASIRENKAFAPGPMAIDALLQVLAVGSGASLGREQAPRLFAATATDLLIRAGSITLAHRRMLLASAAGAGLAAVYNVPAAGVLFACGIILHSWRPIEVLVAGATSCFATVTAWPITHGAPTISWPGTHYSWEAMVFVIAAMPLGASVGTIFQRLTTGARPRTPPQSWTLVPAIGLAALATGICSIWLPQLPGNGKDIVVQSLGGGSTTLAGMGAAVLLKPALTALFIRAGAEGGRLTPALSTGVATGAFVALAIIYLGGHASVPTFALIGGAAVLGITQRAPVFAATFTAELTHPPLGIWAMLLVAAVGANGVLLLAKRHRATGESAKGADSSDSPNMRRQCPRRRGAGTYRR